MSQDAIDLQVCCVNMVNRGELSDELLASVCTSDLALQNLPTAVTDRSYEEPPGIREWTEDFIEAFGPGARVEIEKVIADGDDFVVTRQRSSECLGRQLLSIKKTVSPTVSPSRQI